ncbi:hypothetical protein HNS38_19710 [Lentimicrobium sp. L6]|uniref:hypothetical protein n=1 Tax=Lentimicrobium sp. L6 TaxID=2735916 RepID=UPI00155174C2|nr:hypothetical protein [Lentimicrobium sp. L6]NPD86988.1 hypothetical protein [Lentimicrobium sp. L6]
MFKKIVSNLFLYIIVIFVLDFSVGSFLRYYYFSEESGLHYRTTFSLEETTADILVFGSSRANHHYVPEIFLNEFNMSYYNTGRDGNGILYQTAVLKSILKRYSPKIIILDFYGSFEENTKDYDRLSALLPYYKSHKEIRRIVELKSSYEKIKLLSHIYPYNSMLLTIMIGNTEYNKGRKHDDKGYVPLYKKWRLPIETRDSIFINHIDSNLVDAFCDFISLSKQSGAEVIVAYSPIYIKNQYDSRIAFAKSTCDSLNIDFIDFSNDEVFLSNGSYFQDPSHLNHDGALLFSRQLSLIMRNNILNK